MTDGADIWEFTYDANGLRTQRTDYNHYNYYYGAYEHYEYQYDSSGRLIYMDHMGDTMYFSYDPVTGFPQTMIRSGMVFYYVTNSRGDVMAILDDSGNYCAVYEYDAWGNVLYASDCNDCIIAEYNPLLYRGYIYDWETGLYYLQSRYYDPEIGRFINADAYAATGQGFVGNNMFAYCNNSPVIFKDPSGTRLVIDTPATDFAYLREVKGSIYRPSLSGTSVMSAANSLPRTGEPGSTQTLLNPDGTPKQKRWYGPDGNADRDRDYNHPGDDVDFPHDHEWKNGERQKDHLPPSPDYEFSLDPVLGVGLITVCTVGLVVVALDDATGIGVADDFLLGPLSAGVGKGLIMILG